MPIIAYPLNSQQPQPTAPMSITGGGNGNALNKPVGPDGKRSWSHSLFDCFADLRTCCLATWCPCFANARNARRLRHLSKRGYPHPDRDGVCGRDLWIDLCLDVIWDVGWIMQILTRYEIRKRYNIRGNLCQDILTAVFCTPCGLVQASREIELEEDSFVAVPMTRTMRVAVGTGPA